MASYCLLADLKTALNISDTTDDTLLQAALDSATTAIDDWCGQRFAASTSSTAIRYYYPADDWCLDVDPIGDSTGLVVQVDASDDGTYETTLVLGTDFQLGPVNAPTEVPVRPWTELQLLSGGYGYWPHGTRASVKVTARFGWPTAVPAAVQLACKILGADLYKSKDAAFGVAGGNDFGPLRVQTGINRQAATLLAPYRKGQIG